MRAGRPVREKILDGIIDDNARVIRVRMVGDSEGTFPGDVGGWRGIIRGRQMWGRWGSRRGSILGWWYGVVDLHGVGW